MNSKLSRLLVILGPTASGKTRLACAVANQLKAEIISADSRQVYRYMDIGTGKDIAEYEVNGTKIPYHLIDIRDPGYKYNIAEYQVDFLNVLDDIQSREQIPVLCGGSGLYIEAALKGNSFLGIPMNVERQAELELFTADQLEKLFDKLSDEVKSVLNKETKRRMIRAIIIQEYLHDHPDFKTVTMPEFEFCIAGVAIDREARRQKISDRLSFRMNHGLIEEVEWLLSHYLSHDDLDYYGLEYKWVGAYLRNEINKKELFEGLRIAIQQFSKRQMTWFRRMENNGYKINWVDASMDPDDQLQEVLRIYQH